MEKHEVRAIAEELNLPVYNKPDSQEICFVPDQDYAALLRRRSPESVRPGELVTTDGAVVGCHEGHQNFTIGQRKGVGVAFGRPIYVVDINPSNNRVTLGDKQQLARRSLIAHQINWLANAPLPVNEPIRCQAKIRYNHDPQPASAIARDGALHVEFDEPQSAITPGQAVVLYDEDILLGGGWIESATG
jgi:tRNA-specific 2-thiouridylase